MKTKWILLLVVLLLIAEFGEAAKKSKSKDGKEGKEGKGKKGKGKEESESATEGEESAGEEEEKVSAEEEPAAENTKSKEKQKSTKKDKKKAEEGKCECQPGPPGPPGPQGPPGEKGECVYQPICPDAQGATCTHGHEIPAEKYSPNHHHGHHHHHHTQPPIVITQSGSVITYHSQSNTIPVCPVGQSKLWQGFSLLRFDSSGVSNTNDLGSSASCLPRISTAPFITCGSEGTCKGTQRNDKSFWLTANDTLPEVSPIPANLLANIVSRCTVCDATQNIVAIHSQTPDVPQCPAGWDLAWTGYSFLLHSIQNEKGGAQSTASPGSCLQHFRKALFIECDAASDSCNSSEAFASVWLKAEETEPSGLDETQKRILIENDVPVSVSRCAVCLK